jgi:hypothetical protein
MRTVGLRERLLALGGVNDVAGQKMRWLNNPDGPEAAALIEELVEALRFARQVLADERESLVGSFVNRIGPDKGKVTDGKSWIAPFTKAIKKTDAALAKAHHPEEVLK